MRPATSASPASSGPAPPPALDVRVGCRFVVDVAADTHAVALVEPHADLAWRVRDAGFVAVPHVASWVTEDLNGNRARRFTLPAGRASVSVDAVVSVDPWPDALVPGARALTPEELTPEALRYVLPSRYCESDLLQVEALGRFGGLRPGWEQVQAISDFVHEHIEFDYQRSSPTHSAMTVLHGRTGVCRDFTHLGIGLCRALNLPARYVCGYIPDIGVPVDGPMDFCAWMEVLLDGGWYTFDPRNNRRRIGRVVIARGRDAADVAMLTTFGQVLLVSMEVWADEVPAEPGSP